MNLGEFLLSNSLNRTNIYQAAITYVQGTRLWARVFQGMGQGLESDGSRLKISEWGSLQMSNSWVIFRHIWSWKTAFSKRIKKRVRQSLYLQKHSNFFSFENGLCTRWLIKALIVSLFSNRINILHVSYFKKYNFNYGLFSTQAAIFDVPWISPTIS